MNHLKPVTALLVGVALGVAGTSVATTGSAQGTKPDAPVSTPSFGRYQIVINPNIRADTFLLDTATGKIWSPLKITDVIGEPTVWTPDDKVDNVTEMFRYMNGQVPKPKAP